MTKKLSKNSGPVPSLKFGLFLAPPRLSWRYRASGGFRMFSSYGWKQERLPARHMPVHEAKSYSNFCKDSGIPDKSIHRHIAGGSKFSAGFSMVEVIVMLSIITIISAMVLFSFTGLSEGGAINRSARELALALRRAQDMALVVNQVEVGIPPVSLIPPAVGIKLSRGATDYKIFADLNPRDYRYTSINEDIGSLQILERNTRISAIYYYDVLGSRQPIAAAHIIFAAPEAIMAVFDEDGNSLGDRLEIELITPSASTIKKITVRTSGQINIK